MYSQVSVPHVTTRTLVRCTVLCCVHIQVSLSQGHSFALPNSVTQLSPPHQSDDDDDDWRFRKFKDDASSVFRTARSRYRSMHDAVL